jgi:hypothetical protein
MVDPTCKREKGLDAARLHLPRARDASASTGRSGRTDYERNNAYERNNNARTHFSFPSHSAHFSIIRNACRSFGYDGIYFISAAFEDRFPNFATFATFSEDGPPDRLPYVLDGPPDPLPNVLTEPLPNSLAELSLADQCSDILHRFITRLR